MSRLSEAIKNIGLKTGVIKHRNDSFIPLNLIQQSILGEHNGYAYKQNQKLVI